MTTTSLRTFDHSLATTQEWLKDVQEEMQLSDIQQAFEVVRAVLHTLRDRLPVNETVQFAAQLPMLMQGVYYHEWTPKGKPEKIRDRDEFLNCISEKMQGNYPPQESARAVLRVLARRMSKDEISDVLSNMPKEIKEIW